MQAAKEIVAAACALFAYLTTVLPRARRELRTLGPLPEEKAKNAEAVAVFATLAPRRRRAAVVRAIVALQVAIDLRDVLEEAGEENAAPEVRARIESLDATWRRQVAALPGEAAVNSLLEAAVERCEQGQLHTHRAARETPEALQHWASRLQAPDAYLWWEAAAGATSSVSAHALIAAAADPSASTASAAQIDAAYQPSVGALTVFLDDLVDLEQDQAAGEHNYLDYYRGPEEAAERLALIAGRAEVLLAGLPHSHRHRAILAGVAALYLSNTDAMGPYGRTIRERLLDVLGPGERVLAGFTNLRRGRPRKWPGQAGNSPEP